MKKLYYNIGRAFEYNRKWEFAIKFYLKALDPNKSFPYYRLAFCYEKRGDYGNAIYYYKQAIAINRNKPHWYLRIANTYLALQKEGLAAKYLKLGIVKAPNDNHIQKKYRTIRKKLQMGIPEIETFLYSTDFTDTDLEVSIKGNVSPNFNPDHIKLQLKSRPNYLEKDLYTFTCSPIKISSDKDGIFDAIFLIPFNRLMIDSPAISHVYDFFILADNEQRVLNYERTYRFIKKNNYDFIPYATMGKNFSLIVTRKESSVTNATKEHIVFTLGRIHAQTGVAKTTISLANSLADIGYSVTLVSLDFTGTSNVFAISKKVNFSYASFNLSRKKKQVFNFNSHKKISEEFLNDLHEYFSKLKCDVLYNPVYGKYYLKTIMHAISKNTIKVLGDHTGRRYNVYNYFIENDKEITLDKLIKLTKDHYLFTTIYEMDAFHINNPLVKNVFQKIGIKNILSIPNIVPAPSVLPKPLFEREKKIILIGRLEKDKNFHIALYAYKKLLLKHPNWSLEIYGQGSKEKELTNIIQELKLNPNILKGFSTDVNTILSNSSIHINLSEQESFGLTMVESMNSGCITISTKKTIGARYLIDDQKNGFLSDDNNINSIYKVLDAVITQIENKEPILLNIQKNAFEKAKQFRPENIAYEWKNSINELIRRRELRQLGKGIPEEDIFIVDVMREQDRFIFRVTGSVPSREDAKDIHMKIFTRKHPLLKKSITHLIKPMRMTINNSNIFLADFSIPKDILLSVINHGSGIVNYVWNFSLKINQGQTRIKFFESKHLLFSSPSFDFIPYKTDRNTFSLLIIRKGANLKDKRPTYFFVLPRIDSTGISTQYIINIAEILAQKGHSVTLVVLDLTSVPNQLPISEKIEINYVSYVLHRQITKSFNFNSSHITLPSDYLSALKSFFKNFQGDILYSPVVGAPFLNTILHSLPQKTIKVIGEYSNKRYKLYSKLMSNQNNISEKKIGKIVKAKHLYCNSDYIDYLHIIQPNFQPLFDKLPKMKIIACDITDKQKLEFFASIMESLAHR